MKVLDAANTLLVEGFCVGSFVEIQISSENLITTLSAQHHLDTHGLDLAREEVHRCARPNRRHVVGLEMVNHIRNRIESLLDGEDVLVMHGSEVVCGLARGEEVGGVLEPDREGVELGPGRDRS